MTDENINSEELKDEQAEECSDEKEKTEESVEKEILETDEKVGELQESFIRLQADFANYKRRTEQEKKDYLDLGVTKVINDLLPIIDNFERALEVSDDSKFAEGVEMIYTQLLELLERNGVTEIVALNEKFDPNFHHAVFAEEVDGLESDVVTEVLQKGYKLGDKVLRPAMVKVSQ